MFTGYRLPPPRPDPLVRKPYYILSDGVLISLEGIKCISATHEGWVTVSYHQDSRDTCLGRIEPEAARELRDQIIQAYIAYRTEIL